MKSLSAQVFSSPTSALANPRSSPTVPVAPGISLVDFLLASSLVLPEDWSALPASLQSSLLRVTDREELLSELVKHGLITEYQASRIEAGTVFGLVLGSYRVLDRIGAGGMGVVFRGEHALMRRQVAIKVLPTCPDQDERLLQRFLTEVRIVAQLQHPNIVAAFDAGEARCPEGEGPVMHYFVMEYVPGQDLEDHVITKGPLSVSQAANLMHQIASALAEAHTRNLIHRDVKPSNILLTPQGQAKLLDFGLARTFHHGLTEPGVILGTMEYMAPEQAEDATAVDIRADLFSLGGVTYWALTGEPPFASTGNCLRDLTARLHARPPSVRARRPEVPPELDSLIQRLLAVNPADRYPDPQTLVRVLWPFLKLPNVEHHLPATVSPLPSLLPHSSDPNVMLLSGPDSTGVPTVQTCRIMLVDDDPSLLSFCKFILESDRIECDAFSDGRSAMQALHARAYDLVLLDMHMPEVEGPEICRYLRQLPSCQTVKVIMMSGDANADVMARMLQSEADDFLTKPFSVAQLQGRVRLALRLKAAQDHNEVLRQHLVTINAELEHNLAASDSDLVQTRNALVLTLAKLVERRASESVHHLRRLQRYSRALAEEAARSSPYAQQITPQFIDLLECCVPLHDIGKAGLPDHILLKPGKLDPDERILMQAHTTIGAEMLEEVARQHPSSLAFLRLAIEIVRHHHERFDGQGYPDHLAGTDIPLAARVVGLCDVYDALRSRRVYKPALSHAAATQMILETSPGQFDPVLLHTFQRSGPIFDAIYRDNPD